MKRMMSAAVVGRNRICAFIAAMLVGVMCFAADEQPKLMPLPPIAPGLQLSRLFNDHMVLQRDASNAGYHYLGCAKTFALMGKGFAEALVSFQKIQGRTQQ